MSFRLARSSRARRMLILRGQTDAPSVAAKATYGRDQLTTLRTAVSQKTPQTWVFTGDSGGRLHPEKSSLASLFEARIREVCGRVHDVIIDTTQPRDRLVRLWQQSRPRIFRFDPSAVILELGPGDPRSDRVRHETAAIGRVVAMLQDASVPLVLLPPPAYVPGDADALERQRRRAAMVAEHLSVPLVDVSESRRPSDTARLLMNALGVNCESDVRPLDVVTETRSDIDLTEADFSDHEVPAAAEQTASGERSVEVPGEPVTR